MTESTSDFQRYVLAKRLGGAGGRSRGPGPEYAYSADLAMLRAFERMRPVELAAAAVVRSSAKLMEGQQLGTMMRVTKRQIGWLHQIAKECAETLGVTLPAVYVANSPVINAYTFGTNEDAFIVIHSALLDHFEEDEIRFVVGHEMGHIQNRHVVYGTVLRVLKTSAALFLRWIIAPAEVALATWSRRAEITCDRAGLLCARDFEAGARSFLKLACGSRRVYDELDLEEYLEQFEDARVSPGRYQELLASHPYLPKRIHALRVFSESELYRRHLRDALGADAAPGLEAEGLDMNEVDARTSAILEIAEPRVAGDPNQTRG